MSYLEVLAPEILLIIFKQLDLEDILKLRLVCRTFRDFVDSWDHCLLKPGYEPLAASQRSNKFLNRCFRIIQTKREKLKIEHNWLRGRYKEYPMFRSRERFMPCLNIDKEFVWFSRGKEVKCFKRTQRLIESKAKRVWCPFEGEEITKFRIKNGFFLCGHSEGSISIQSLRDLDNSVVAKSSTGIKEYAASVDVNEEFTLLAAGMRADCVKFLAVKTEPNLTLEEISLLEFEASRVWCVNFCKDRSSMLAVGTGQYSYRDCSRSVYIYDTEKFVESVNLSSRSQKMFHETLDLKWDGPHTLWSCGNEELLRWDLRMGQIVQKYNDPFCANFYCMALDYCNTLAVGSNLHGKVTVFDTRQEKMVGMFFMESCRGDGRSSSPVYSLSFDSEMLFVATDRHLNILNFNFKENVKDRNYYASWIS